MTIQLLNLFSFQNISVVRFILGKDILNIVALSSVLRMYGTIADF